MSTLERCSLCNCVCFERDDYTSVYQGFSDITTGCLVQSLFHGLDRWVEFINELTAAAICAFIDYKIVRTFTVVTRTKARSLKGKSGAHEKWKVILASRAKIHASRLTSLCLLQ